MTTRRNSWARSKAAGSSIQIVSISAVKMSRIGPRDHVRFLVDRRGGLGPLDPQEDDLPEPEQVGEVAGQLALGALEAGGPDDEAEPLGGVQLVHDLAELATLPLVGDLPRDADPVQAGHQHEVAAGDADVGREGRAFRPDALLDDLDQDLVAPAQALLDRRLDHAATARGAGPRAARLGVVVVAAAGAGVGRAAQAHLALELGDLLHFPADFLLQPRVEIVVGRDEFPLLERFLVVLDVLVEIRLVAEVEVTPQVRVLLGDERRLDLQGGEGGLLEFLVLVIRVGVFGRGRGDRLAFGPLALAAPTTPTSTTSSPVDLIRGGGRLVRGAIHLRLDITLELGHEVRPARWG
jgi:hypothetical protein